MHTYTDNTCMQVMYRKLFYILLCKDMQYYALRINTYLVLFIFAKYRLLEIDFKVRFLLKLFRNCDNTQLPLMTLSSNWHYPAVDIMATSQSY